jgi:proteasome inhibitor subunit 1 (PI31)
MSNPLSTSNILQTLPTLLPTGTSSPLPRPTDAIAALVHTIHTNLDFRLISPAPALATSSTTPNDSEHEGDDDIDIDDTASETPTAVDQEDNDTGEAQAQEGRLPEGWNARGEDSYTFEYRHEQSSLVFRIRVGRMGGRVQIDAMAEVCFGETIWGNADSEDRMARLRQYLSY